MTRLCIVALLAFASVGCQSKTAGLNVLCQAPLTCTECANAEPSMRQMLLARHIEDNLSNGEVEQMFEALANADPASRVELVQAELDAAGITDCPMLEMWAPIEVEIELPSTPE